MRASSCPARSPQSAAPSWANDAPDDHETLARTGSRGDASGKEPPGELLAGADRDRRQRALAKMA